MSWRNAVLAENTNQDSGLSGMPMSEMQKADKPFETNTPLTKDVLRNWLWPLLCPGISYRQYWKLLCQLGSPDFLQDLQKEDAERMQIDAEIVASLQPEAAVRNELEAEIETSYRWLASASHHHVILAGDNHYPELLREIADPPPLLFAAGNLSALNMPSVALVGSRGCTPYGSKITRRLAMEISDAGFVITSGLALGVDSVAHRSCVDRNRPTIAILGSGLANIYPAANFTLAKHIIDKGGLVLSEFPLSAGPAKYRFPQRNRLISGLSLATCVVEASLRSGSLITARLALEQNRLVFAVPGSVDSQNSRGCHRLLREGAAVAENAADIKEPLAPLIQGQLDLLHDKQQENETVHTSAAKLNAQEDEIMHCVEAGPIDTDSLLRSTGLTVSKLQQNLARLELKGLLILHNGQWFRRD
tara:strand:- start:11631 stop:12884 length:1254 start_codon:yes stop_codon:yes gene_type:complete